MQVSVPGLPLALVSSYNSARRPRRMAKQRPGARTGLWEQRRCTPSSTRAGTTRGRHKSAVILMPCDINADRADQRLECLRQDADVRGRRSSSGMAVVNEPRWRTMLMFSCPRRSARRSNAVCTQWVTPDRFGAESIRIERLMEHTGFLGLDPRQFPRPRPWCRRRSRLHRSRASGFEDGPRPPHPYQWFHDQQSGIGIVDDIADLLGGIGIVNRWEHAAAGHDGRVGHPNRRKFGT